MILVQWQSLCSKTLWKDLMVSGHSWWVTDTNPRRTAPSGNILKKRWVWVLFMSHTVWDYRNAKRYIFECLTQSLPKAHDLRVMMSHDPHPRSHNDLFVHPQIPKHVPTTGPLPLQLFSAPGTILLQIHPWSLLTEALCEHTSLVCLPQTPV